MIHTAVDSPRFELGRNECFGLLDVNGACETSSPHRQHIFLFSALEVPEDVLTEVLPLNVPIRHGSRWFLLFYRVPKTELIRRITQLIRVA